MRKTLVPVFLALCAAFLGGCAGGGMNGGSLLPAASQLHSLDSMGGGILAKRMHHDDSMGGGILGKRMHHDDSMGGGILKKH